MIEKFPMNEMKDLKNSSNYNSNKYCTLSIHFFYLTAQ